MDDLNKKKYKFSKGHRDKLSKSHIGLKHSKETIKKMEKRIPWNKGIIGEKSHSFNRIFSDERKNNISLGRRNSFKAVLSAKFWAKKMGKKNKGRVVSKETIEKHRRLFTGENNPMWKGGNRKSVYPREFNYKLKLKIRTRDNFTCCLCRRTEREELNEFNRVLAVNHIDWDKSNNSEENLNTLCLRCNLKINKEKDYWINYFKKIENDRHNNNILNKQ